MSSPFTKPPLMKGGLKKPPLSASTGDTGDDSSSSNSGSMGQFSPLQAKEAFRSPPSLILPHIYLGNQANAANRKQLSQLDITRVLSLKERHVGNESTEEFLAVPMSDHGDTPIADVLPECFRFLDDTNEKNQIALVHCRGGVNRSATIVLAYLMYREKMTLVEAWEFVRNKRPAVAPVEDYMRQLREYEFQLFGKTTLEKQETGPTLTQRIDEWRAHRKNVSMPAGLSASKSGTEDLDIADSGGAGGAAEIGSTRLEKEKKSHTSPVGELKRPKPFIDSDELSGSQDALKP